MKILLAKIVATYRNWQRWSQTSTNRQIFSASIVVGALTAIVSLVGLIKEMVIARSLGLSDQVDAYLFSLSLATLMVNVIAGSFHAAFVPVYIQLKRHQGIESTKLLNSNILALIIILLGAAVLFLVFTTPIFLPLLASGFAADKLALTQKLLFIQLPILVISSLSMYATALLHAEERFAQAALSSISIHVTVISVFLVYHTKIGGGMALAIGTTLGYLIQMFWLIEILRRYGLLELPRWSGRTKEIGHVTHQAMWIALGSLSAAGAGIIPISIAASLAPGSVAAFNYGNKLPATFSGLATMSLSTAALPYLSVLTAKRDWYSLRHALIKGSSILLIASLLATLLLVALSQPIVRLLYERGAFTHTDTSLVTGIQALLLLQLPFYLLGTLQIRLLNALSLNRIVFLTGFATLLLTGVFCWSFSFIWNVAGVGLGVSMVYFCTALGLFIFLRSVLATRMNGYFS